MRSDPFCVCVEWSDDAGFCTSCLAPLLDGSCGILIEGYDELMVSLCKRCSVQVCLLAGGGVLSEFLHFVVDREKAA